MLELTKVKRVTLITEAVIEEEVIQRLYSLGAKGYTVCECRGAGKQGEPENPMAAEAKVRIEVLCHPPVAEKIVEWFVKRVIPNYAAVISVETAEVVRSDFF